MRVFFIYVTVYSPTIEVATLRCRDCEKRRNGGSFFLLMVGRDVSIIQREFDKGRMKKARKLGTCHKENWEICRLYLIESWN